MVFRFAFSFQYLNVIIFLSSRERSCPIQFRHWCRNHIGVFPFGLYPHGFMFGFFGLQHHRDHGHDFTFSKLRKDLQSQIWDPGDSNYKTEIGGLRSLTSHIYGSLLVFGSEIGLSVSPRSATLLLLCIDVGILSHLMLISFGIGELLLKFKTRDINLGFADEITRPQSDEFVAPVHDYVGCDYFSFVMELCLHQFRFRWSAMSIHVGWVKFWRQGLVCVVDIWRLKNALATFRWESYDMRRSDFWDAMVNLFVVMLEKWYDQAIRLWLDLIVFVALQPLHRYYAHTKVIQVFLDDQLDAKTRKFVLSYSHLFVVVPNKNSSSEASALSMRCALWSLNKEMFFTHTFRISGRTKREKEIVNSSDSTEKRTMDIIAHQWVGRYRRHDSESFQATYQSTCSIKVMRKAFRSFIYKMIACYKCMKRGLNRFILLPVRLLLESRVTSTSSSKLGFNFLYLFQRLYLNGFLYHVSCKPFMK